MCPISHGGFADSDPGVAETGALTEKDEEARPRAARHEACDDLKTAFEDDMPTFTVHVPSGIVDDVERAERTIFVRDAFSLPAFVFGPLFLVYRRLWRAILAWILAAVALSVLTRVLALPIPVTLLLFLVLAVLVGLEANEARRQALGRRGYIGSALVTGSTRTKAERMFFAGSSPTGFGTAAGRSAGALYAPSDPARTGTRPVIGLFPPPGGTTARRP